MLLRRVDILGFKSFADRIALELGPSLTAIVGPNGSGKSNITDAVRWVLGEQSAAKLRASRMEDLIFGGSRTRKPMGMAQVSITLDNSNGLLPLDYAEVVLTRRLFRDGASEYLLNGSQVRLRDVLETLLDTGFGRALCAVFDEPRMEAILSARSGDRRAVLEEAAGVARFRLRRDEARRKLEETRADLVRLTDVIGELERGLPALEAEAARLRSYQALRERMRAVALWQLGRELTSLDAAATRLASRVPRTEAGYRQAQSLSEEASAEADRLERIQAEAEAAAAAVHSDILALARESERLRGLLGMEAARHEAVTKEEATLASQEDNDRRLLAGLSAELVATEAELERLREDGEGAARRREELAAREAALESSAAELDAQARSLSNHLSAVEEGLQDLRARLGVAEAEAASREERARLAAEQRRRTQEALTAIEARIESLTAQVRAARSSLEGAQSAVRQAREEAERAQSGVSSRRRDLESARAELAARSAALRALEELVDGGDGCGQGAREVLTRRHQLGGVVGAVAELVTVPPELVEAIEAALGDVAAAVVVETLADARRAIAFLRRNGLGRAVFLPVGWDSGLDPADAENRAADAWLRNRVTGLAGVRGIAADLVGCEPRISQLVGALLGRVVVCDDAAAAEHVMSATQRSACAVTLAGEAYHPDGRVSGGGQPPGQRDERHSPLGRRALMEASRKRLEEAAARVGTLESELRAAEERAASSSARLGECEARARQAELEGVALASEVATLVRQAQAMKREAGEAEPGAAAETLELDRRRLVDLESTRHALMSEREELMARRAALLDELRGERQALADVGVEMARITSARDAAAASASRLRKEIGASDQRVHDCSARRERLRRDRESSAARISALRAKQAEVDGRVTELERTAGELKTRLESTRVALQDARRRVREASELAAALAGRAEREKAELAAIQARRAELRTKIEVDWSATVEDAVEEASSTPDVVQESVPADAREPEREVWALVRRLQAELAGMEPINHRALDDLEVLRGRLASLKAKLRDADEARTRLEEAARELERVAAEHFVEAFECIRQEFRRTFQRLFDGGECDLVLSGDTANALDCEIELVAAPPGKRRTPISLLSGGEKALTATALMFAMIAAGRVRFCILDEVDAVLDDANVARFVSLLRELSSTTQMVVVTHRRRTMEAATRVYGVTMQDAGVSIVGSVNLDRIAS